MHSFLRAATVGAASFVLLSVGATVAQGQSAAFKIAFVSPAALIDNAPGRAAADSLFNKETQTFSDQLKRMNDSLNAMILNYQKAEPTLTAAQKETRTKAIQTYEQDFRAKQQQLQQQAQARQSELMAPIMEQVKKVLDDIRVEDGYALIIAGDPNLILSYDKNLDITDRVVARLKTVAAVKAPPKPGAVSAPAGVTRKP
jgi:outer membrane protein